MLTKNKNNINNNKRFPFGLACATMRLLPVYTKNIMFTVLYRDTCPTRQTLIYYNKHLPNSFPRNSYIRVFKIFVYTHTYYVKNLYTYICGCVIITYYIPLEIITLSLSWSYLYTGTRTHMITVQSAVYIIFSEEFHRSVCVSSR